jgi:hypothetical protein
MGDVQSGKTANYCGLVSKAADAGYKIIVLLTGVIEDLRAQSQERLDEGFVGRDSRELLNGRQSGEIGAGRFRFAMDANGNRIVRTPNVLTSVDSDFLRNNLNALGGIPLKNIREPVLLVMKKNKSPLDNLIRYLDTQIPKGASSLDLPLLLIDDESDNASVNSMKDNDPATINRLIRELLQRFGRASYVGYTATPFANVFINSDIEGELFPSNFVYSLSAPTNYLGVGSFFSQNGTHADCVEDFTDAALAAPMLVGLAKQEETLVKPDGTELRLPRHHEGLRLVQRLRDEAHRFANDFNAELRGRKLRESLLDEVVGLGPSRKAALLERFGSIQALRKASVEQLSATPGVGPALAARVAATLTRRA